MLLWVIRAVFLLVLAGTAARITNEFGTWLSFASGGVGEAMLFASILGIGVIAVVIDIVYPRKEISTISGIYFGVLIGTLLGHLLEMAFGPSISAWANPRLTASLWVIMTTVLCYICVSILIQTKNDFRFIIPYVEFSRQIKGSRPLVLDTSVIIDGRIADIAETGLIDQVMVVPRFVLNEIQAIADSSDRLRRSRGRRGLDVLDRIQKCARVEVDVHEADTRIPNRQGTDAELIVLSQRLNGKLVTNDFNLAKMAKIQGVETININEVSNAAKPPVHHGEVVSVRLVKEGEGPGQGIGYLDDGTMVVAEMGKAHVGKDVNLVVTSVLQTQLGRMVFGKIEGNEVEPARPAHSRS